MDRKTQLQLGAAAIVVIIVAFTVGIALLSPSSSTYQRVTVATISTPVSVATIQPSTATTTVQPNNVQILGNQQYQNVYIKNYSIVIIPGNNDNIAIYISKNVTAIIQISGNSSTIKMFGGYTDLNLSGMNNQIHLINTTVISINETGRNNAILSA